MRHRPLYIWKKAPFLRLIIPFIAGILLQWYGQVPAIFSWIPVIICIVAIILFNKLSPFIRFRFSWINGACIYILLLCTGALVCFYKDISHHTNWIKRHYRDSAIVIATLQEPLSEKAKSYKSVASVHQIIINNTIHLVEGSIIIYFNKDSAAQQLNYGSQIIFNKPLQNIRNSGNPGSFNYERYAAFQQQYYQVYLKKSDYVVESKKQQQAFKLFLFEVRRWIVEVINKHIPHKKEAGLASALLIGYKDDLDKTLVQSYSNTGVVHVIAISGLHLGIIYWLLKLLASPLKKKKRSSWISTIVVITGLWLFALLAGAGPSVLRSALMFSCIALGEGLSEKASVYNTLAASAFLLLCYHPFWLWDAGFQLSYTAVLSIVIFRKPIYNWFYISNKALDILWKLNAVTISAQILTLPVSIYHFHQFPNYFLVTNLVAVPLSSIVLIGEIFLCIVASLSPAANFTGKILQWLIAWMNNFIVFMEQLPFAVWSGLQISIAQVLLLYAIITAVAYWLWKKKSNGFVIGLGCLFIFLTLYKHKNITTRQQRCMIVYNIPGHRAVDFIDGKQYYFKGDSVLLTDDVLQNLYLKPARILYQVQQANSLNNLFNSGNASIFGTKRIILVDSSWNFVSSNQKIKADVIILSGNTCLTIEQLQQTFNCSQVVIDGSNSRWKVNKWRSDCEKRQLACHCVVDKGAFVMHLP
jgi:competence protein ComEC